jgi:N-methylhydantoinase A
VADEVLGELFAELESRATGREGTREIAFDMRYTGQEHSLTIPIAGDGSVTATAEEIRAAFAADYERTFGHTMEEAVEIVSFRATIRTPLPRHSAEQQVGPSDGAAPSGSI